MEEKQLPEVEVTEEMLQDSAKTIKDDIFYFRNKIVNGIDNLSGNAAKRLLKVCSCISFANEILGREPIKLKKEEGDLLNTTMKLQEDCMGYIKLCEELGLDYKTLNPKVIIENNTSEEELTTGENNE